MCDSRSMIEHHTVDAFTITHLGIFIPNLAQKKDADKISKKKI